MHVGTCLSPKYSTARNDADKAAADDDDDDDDDDDPDVDEE